MIYLYLTFAYHFGTMLFCLVATIIWSSVGFKNALMRILFFCFAVFGLLLMYTDLEIYRSLT